MSCVLQFLEKSGKDYWGAVKRILRYFKGIFIYGICYKVVLSDSDFVFRGFADADWVSDSEIRRSLSVYCFFFCGAVVIWSTKKQISVVFFFTEVEYKVLTDAVKEAEWVRFFFTVFQFF